MGWIFKQLLSHTTLGLPGKEMRILASRPSIQMCAQDIFPAGSKNVPDRPGLTSSLLQRKYDRTAVWRLL